MTAIAQRLAEGGSIGAKALTLLFSGNPEEKAELLEAFRSNPAGALQVLSLYGGLELNGPERITALEAIVGEHPDGVSAQVLADSPHQNFLAETLANGSDRASAAALLVPINTIFQAIWRELDSLNGDEQPLARWAHKLAGRNDFQEILDTNIFSGLSFRDLVVFSVWKMGGEHDPEDWADPGFPGGTLDLCGIDEPEAREILQRLGRSRRLEELESSAMVDIFADFSAETRLEETVPQTPANEQRAKAAQAANDLDI